jgi:DNA-directed RNA polymerase specialized sigma24 family protein
MIAGVRISGAQRDVYDVEEVEELYRKLTPGLRAYAERLGLPPDEAEGVVHDAFLAYLTAKGPIDDARKWLFGAVRNGAFSKRRKAQRVPPDGRWQETNPDARIFAYEILRVLAKDERQVLWMKEAEGYRVHEIARRRGRSISWVEKTLRRAREAAKRKAAESPRRRRVGRRVRRADTYDWFHRNVLYKSTRFVFASTGFHRSPACSSRETALSIRKSSIFTPRSTSSHVTGIDAPANGVGRTE